MCFLVLFRLDLRQISFNLVKNAFATWQHRILLHFGSRVCRNQNFEIVFVWDFPTLCWEQRYFFLYLFICIQEPRLCDLVSIRKREDPGYEALGMQWDLGNECCVAAIRVLSVGDLFQNTSTCFPGAINLQGKAKSSSLLTFFIVLSELWWLYCKESLYSRI